jgi:hypothetical protein
VVAELVKVRAKVVVAELVRVRAAVKAKLVVAELVKVKAKAMVRVRARARVKVKVERMVNPVKVVNQTLVRKVGIKVVGLRTVVAGIARILMRRSILVRVMFPRMLQMGNPWKTVGG